LKAKEFAARLDELADLIETARGDVRLLRAFAQAVARLGSKQVGPAFHGVCINIDAPRSSAGEFGHIAKLLSAAHPFCQATSKKAFLDDIILVSKVLESLKTADLTDFEARLPSKRAANSRGSNLRTDVIDRYVSMLAEALQDPEGFGRLFDTLQKDKSVRREEAIEIAMRVSGKIAKSASKRKALGSIEATHVRRVGAKLRQEYFRNQSAA